MIVDASFPILAFAIHIQWRMSPNGLGVFTMYILFVDICEQCKRKSL